MAEPTTQKSVSFKVLNLSWRNVRAVFHTAQRAQKAFARDLALAGAFFVLTISLISLAKTLFGYQFIHIFDISFASFHAFFHLILHVLVFSWLIFLMKLAFYSLLKVASLFADIKPFWPHIVFPVWISDFAFVSLALTRVFQTTDLVVPRAERAKAESQMNPDLWIEIEIAEGPFWGSIHKFLDHTNARIWHVVDRIKDVLIWPFPRREKYSLLARRIAIALLGVVFFWGYIRLAGYIINIIGSRSVSSPIMITRRKFFRFFCIHFVGAVAATVLFIVMNGWLIDYLNYRSMHP